MFLTRIHLNPRSREARRDLANPYELHSTLCRAFSSPDRKCPEGEFLWRLEPEGESSGVARILVQSRSLPEWSRIGLEEWFAEPAERSIDLTQSLKLMSISAGQRYRFRLRANPCVSRNGKRQGLFQAADQESWLVRKGREQGGFELATVDSVRITQEQMLKGKQRNGNAISVYSVLFDGFLTVVDPDRFRCALQQGIGHGKTLGLGLLSVVPAP